MYVGWEQQNSFILFLVATGSALLVLFFYLYQQNVAAMSDNQLSANKRKDYVPWFIALIIIALMIRIAIGYSFPGYESDVTCFRVWANNSYELGFSNFYSGDFFADYPPLYIYILSFVGFLGKSLGIELMSPMFGLMVRMPSFVFDVILAVFIFKTASEKLNEKAGIFLSALILLNPAIFVNNALWGQVDVVVTVFMVFTLYSLYKDRPYLTAVLFALSLLIKPQAIMIGPIILYYFIRKIVISKNKKHAVGQLLLALLIVVALLLLLPLPFGVGKEPLWLLNQMMETVGQYPQASLNAFNLFSIFGLNFLSAKDFVFLGLTLDIWGFILIAITCAYVLWLYIKEPNNKMLFAYAAFIVLGVYAFAHGMHERYIYVVPVLLLVSYIFVQKRRLLVCTLLLFGVSLVNTGVSLYYYQQWIPNTLIVLLSIASMAVYMYTFYSISRVAFAIDNTPRQGNRKGNRLAPSYVQQRKKGEQMRIQQDFQMNNKDALMHRRDIIIMLIITAIYAFVAFANLGSFRIPETSKTLYENTFIEFEETENISRIQYFAGYGEGAFDVYASTDGDEFYSIPLPIEEGITNRITHEKSELYKWQFFDVDIEAKYIQIVPADHTPPILELGFFAPDGEQLKPLLAYTENSLVPELIDEQDLATTGHDYMNEFYFDELYHVRTAYEHMHGITPYEITHPPLGKILIAFGIQLFGMNPFGWRFMGTLAGVAMLPILFVLVKRMLKQTKYAAFASILLAADFMHFTQTRIGTIDSFSILFILLMYLFMYLYTQRSFNKEPLSKTLLPLLLCGISFGLGAATKWLCLYAGLGLLAIYIITLVKRHREHKSMLQTEEGLNQAARYRRNLSMTLLASILFFIVIPVAIYLLSYAPYFLVQDGGAYRGIGDILGNQSYMLNYHAYLDPESVHPFSSMWYTWPFNIRPVLFFSQQNLQQNTIATMSTMGNPLIWWSGLIAVGYIVIKIIRRKEFRSPDLLFLAIAALSQFAPWWFVSREVFIYHYFATVPFLIVFIVYWLRMLEVEYSFGHWFGYIFVATCAIMFVVFYPVITGVPAHAEYVNSLRWLESWPFY